MSQAAGGLTKAANEGGADDRGDGRDSRPDTMASEAVTELRPGTTATTGFGTSRPGTKTHIRPVTSGVGAGNMEDAAIGGGHRQIGAQVLGIAGDGDAVEGVLEGGGGSYAAPADRMASSARPTTAPAPETTGRKSTMRRRRALHEKNESGWVPYGWTAGFKPDDMRKSAVADEMGGPEVALEVPARSGSPTREEEALDVKPHFPEDTPQWFVKAEMERLGAKDRDRQRDLEREAAERTKEMMETYKKKRAEAGDADDGNQSVQVRLERTLEDTRFDFFIEAADRKLRDALDGVGDASARAGRSEQRVNVINKELATGDGDDAIQERLEFARWDARRQERMFHASEFTQIGAIERFSRAKRTIKEQEEALKSRNALREEAHQILQEYPKWLARLEVCSREVARYRHEKKEVEAVAPRLKGHGGDLISMPKGGGTGEVTLVKLEKLEPRKVAKPHGVRMTIQGLLRGQVVTEEVETKPFAPALKSGWMYVHGLNRVTKQDCWLRRWGQLMPNTLLACKERPKAPAGDGIRPSTAPAAFGGSIKGSFRMSARKDSVRDASESYALREMAFVTPMGDDRVCLVTDDGVTTILRFQGGSGVRDAWRAALCFAVEGARKGRGKKKAA